MGAVEHDMIIDLTTDAPDLPREMTALLAAGPDALARARDIAANARSRIPLEDARLEPPILRPPKFLAVGLNYAEHASESGREPPAYPTIFNKQSTCVTGPRDPIYLPRAAEMVDYEGELGLVIGRRCRHVPRERAHEVIAGYLVVNDVSTRDWQWRTPTWTLGKSFDTHGPIGPWIVTADELGDPHKLRVRTWVSGELRQDSDTSHLIFDCFALVEHLSSAFTFEPGDIVSTGTPAGVGCFSDPQRFLVAGDVVRIAVEGIGEIENPVIQEPEGTVLI